MKSLDIGIPSGRNSEYYLQFLITSIERTLSKKYEHRYLIGVNDASVNCKNIEDFFERMGLTNYKIIRKIQDKSGISNGHGKCLDIILDTMDADYGVFLDSDVYMLTKNWDNLLVEQLDSKHIIIGSEYHHSDGKIVNFPNVITCLFDVAAIKKLNISFIPECRTVVTNEDDSHYYGVKPGQKVYLDTGCHISKVIKQAGLDGKILDIVSPRYSDTRHKMKFMLENMRGEEYQLKGIPISTHVGRSSSRSFLSDPIVINWRERIKDWVDYHG